MKVRSAILTEMSGKIGGAVASQARGGIQYFRKLVTPSNPRSDLQTFLRSAVASASSAWKNELNDSQRDQWWDAAEGSQSGKSLYCRVNNARLYALNAGRYFAQTDAAAITRLDSPPTDFSTSLTAPTLVLDQSSHNLQVTALNNADPYIAYSDDGAGGTGLLFVYVSHPQTSSRRARQHPYELVCTMRCGPVGTFVDHFNVDLTPLGFTLVTGRVAYVKVQAQHPSGGLSVAQEQRITIQA